MPSERIQKQMKNGDRIFVENSPGIGDLVLMTPYLRALKKKYPKATITVGSTNPFSLQVIERIPYIDNVLSLKKGFWNYLRIIRVLRKQDYVVFNTYQPIYARMAKYIGVRHRAGNIKEEYAGKNWFNHNFPRENTAELKYYQTDYFMNKFNIGLEDSIEVHDYVCDVSYPNRDETANAKKKLFGEGYREGKHYILLSPFGNTSANLKPDTLRCIIDFFREREYAVVVSGVSNPSMRSFWEELSSKGDVFDMQGKTTIMEMEALMCGADAVVSLDSGPMHVSCGLKKKTIAFFTSTLVSEWAPKAYCYPISLNMSCAGACEDGGPASCPDHVCTNFKNSFVREQLEKGLKK